VSSRVRVVIADDHPAARAGVREALEADGGFEIVAEAADAPAATTVSLAERPDLCMLDIRMPGNGIRAAQEIVSALPATAAVMLTVSRDDQDLFAALRAGAAGYLLKDTDPVRLPHALRGVLAGEAALPRALVARVLDQFRSQGQRRLRLAGRRRAELTGREWQILDLLHEGRTTKEMAESLFVSPVTVRRHVSAILRKLQAVDRQAAVRLMDEGDR
jgi:DNA-binding NarL/FixJ family response regulator